MVKNKENIKIGFLNEVELNKNSKEIIELLNVNYSINFPNHYDFCNFSNSNYNDMKKFISNGSALVVGAYSGSKIIGFLWAYKRLVLGDERLHISHIVVGSAFRGCGIGSRMIEFIEQYAFENGIKIIELLTTSKNERTMEFYSKNGYIVTRVQFEKNLGEKDDN